MTSHKKLSKGWKKYILSRYDTFESYSQVKFDLENQTVNFVNKRSSDLSLVELFSKTLDHILRNTLTIENLQRLPDIFTKSTMAAYASLVSLMNNIDQIQRHTRLPICPDRNQMKSLYKTVTFLIDFLDTYKSHEENEEMKDLEIQIADAAYEAEDIIETHVVDKIRKSISSDHDPSFVFLPTLEKVMQHLEFIKEELLKVNHDKREVQDLFTGHISTSVQVGNDKMVGFDNELDVLLERLARGDSRCQVIPIVGMGGIGKTTLAKYTYDHPLIVQHFYFQAWVSISQEYSLRQILIGILGKEYGQMSEAQLSERLHKSLFGRKYLVVLDDMWSTKDWEQIMSLFPENDNGSRVIVTTRKSSIASYFGWRSLEMKFLDDEKSWTLFCENVFAKGSCPVELKEVGQKIVKNCKGLPLSIVVIGGLLVKSKRIKEWENIAEDTTAIIGLESDEHCMKILYLSYRDLPVSLKPCFLYLGVFPEDTLIRVSWLIKLWVAEGILKPSSLKEAEDVGEQYLKNLVSRNLIHVNRRGFDGKIKFCVMHDLLRDFCLKECHKEKFLQIPKMNRHDNIQCLNSQRRFSIHQSSSHESHISQILDTLKSVSTGRSLICDIPGVLPLQNLSLLRILKVNDNDQRHSVKYWLDDIFQLVNSRFIAINTIKHPMFPSSIGLLWNLQVLIVRGNAEGLVVPSEIWHMIELRHLQFEHKLYLPDPPSVGTNKQVVMKNLQTLKGVDDFRCSDEVVNRIPNIKKLRICNWRNFTGEFNKCRLKNLGLLKKLESLTCSFAVSRSDRLSQLTFPSSLNKLTLEGCGLPWADMKRIGSLPHLEVLKLKYDAFVGPEWLTDEDEFCRLKYLEIFRCEDLMLWESENSHFPCLKHLFLHALSKLEKIPSDLGETLKYIQLEHCSSSAIISAKTILDEQEGQGNVGLQVRVLCRKNTEVESMASDSFLVEVW